MTAAGPSLHDIHQASRILEGRVHRTPLFFSDTLSRLTGHRVWLKAENLQKTGSFKPRGNIVRLARLSAAERERGVIAASAGNHAQGLAYAARAVGVPCTVVMPENAPPAKLAATRGYGATVELHGEIYDDAEAYAEELAEQSGMVTVHPCTDLDVVAGHGTVGLEILDELPSVTAIVVPVGGGGLVGGIAIAVRESRPGVPVRLIGVQPEQAAPMHASLAAGRLVELSSAVTIADGLAGRTVYLLTLELVQRYLDDLVLVSEREMLDAILLILSRTKLLTEASGAASVAALLSGRIDLPPASTVVCVLSGGNQDLALLARWIEAGIEATGTAR
jgi:threonine dehydratase